MHSKKCIDLHIHSRASDGNLSLSELIEKANMHNLCAIAITDHDTFKGVKKCLQKSEAYGLEVIAGIEVSAVYRNAIIHILVYEFDLDGVFAQKIEALEKKNLRNYIDYKKGNKFVYIREYIDAHSLLKLVRLEGGTAILAHPKRVSKNLKKLEETVGDLTKKGLCGIESFHAENRLFDQFFLRFLAWKYNLLSTGGSDFHKEGDKFGKIRWNRKISYQYLLKLKDKSRENKNEIDQRDKIWGK